MPDANEVLSRAQCNIKPSTFFGEHIPSRYLNSKKIREIKSLLNNIVYKNVNAHKNRKNHEIIKYRNRAKLKLKLIVQVHKKNRSMLLSDK